MYPGNEVSSMPDVQCQACKKLIPIRSTEPMRLEKFSCPCCGHKNPVIFYQDQRDLDALDKRLSFLEQLVYELADACGVELIRKFPDN